MSKESQARSIISHLETLERNTEIIKIDLKSREARSLLEKYVEEHKKQDGEEIARGSFNDFLKQHDQFKKRCKNKVVVAEITGSLGFDNEDEYSDSNIHIDGGNFTGCRFKNVKFHEIRDVSLRDCVFEKVLIKGGQSSNVDLRGTRLDNLTFFDWSPNNSLKEIQLGFADPNAVQDKGVFALIDRNAEGLQIMHAEGPIERKESKEIKAYLEDQRKKRGWAEWFSNTGPNPKLWGTYLWNNEDLSTEQQEYISSITEKYDRQREEIRLQARRDNPIRFSNPSLDPTYIPNQSPKEANAIRVPLKATKEDLEEYLASARETSFNDFIADKHEHKLNEISAESGERIVIPVADLSGENLSRMDLSELNLSGVNFSYCNMKECILTKSSLKGSCLEGSNLTKANLEETELTDCNMIGITAKEAHFEKAIMIRTQMNYAELEGAHFEGAVGYLSCLVGSNMEHACLRETDMRRSDLQHVNLRYVDAQYADMRGANLSRAVADHANFAHANLSGAIAEQFSAQEANLEETVMDGIQAHFADLRKAKLSKVKAKGADFSSADLREIQATDANFEKAILRKADVAFANFEKAILKDVKAQEANFQEAVLKDIEAERIDISRAVLDKANLESAKMHKAVMEDISARKTKFKKAFLKEANLKRAILVGADFRSANLSAAEAQGAAFVAANLEGATVRKMKTDPSTLLIDANLRGLVGDKKTIEGIKALQNEQHLLHKQWFGKSRYGFCTKNKDGSNDRFKCQRLGAAVLSSALGGGAGVALAGPLAGIQTAAIATLINDQVLLATKEHYFNDLGYINNSLGDRLAEVGAVALSMGVNAADRAIDGAVAGLVCSVSGVVQGVALTTVGVGTTLGGLQLSMDGIKEQSRWKKITGAILTGVGAIASFFGISSLGASLNTIALGTAIGGITGGLWAGVSAAKRLYQYNDKIPNVGARPEHIYRESIVQAKGIWRKIVPTMKKVLLGIALAVASAAATVAAVKSLPIIGAIGIAKSLIAAHAAVIAATAGFFVGYLYDDKIIPTKKTSPIGKQKIDPDQTSIGSARTQSVSPGKTIEKNFTKQHPSKSKEEFAKQHPSKSKEEFAKQHPPKSKKEFTEALRKDRPYEHEKK